MYGLEADHPLGPYHSLGQICDPRHDTWAIDMTVSSTRAGCTPCGRAGRGRRTLPQHLYIAPMADPGTISGERVRISSPEYNWEMRVAPLNEGPQVLRTSRRQAVHRLLGRRQLEPGVQDGLLEWTGGGARPAAWKKLPRPILTGGGHGCFIEAAGSGTSSTTASSAATPAGPTGRSWPSRSPWTPPATRSSPPSGTPPTCSSAPDAPEEDDEGELLRQRRGAADLAVGARALRRRPARIRATSARSRGAGRRGRRWPGRRGRAGPTRSGAGRAGVQRLGLGRQDYQQAPGRRSDRRARGSTPASRR